MSKRDGMTYSKDGRWYPRVVRHLAVGTAQVDLEELGYYYETEAERYETEIVALCGQRLHPDATDKYRHTHEDVTCMKCIKKGNLKPKTQNRITGRGYSR